METTDSDPNRVPLLADGQQAKPRPAELAPRHRGVVWIAAIGAGVVAGLASWLGGELARGAFQKRHFEVVILQMKTIQSTTLSENAAAFKNAALTFGILGLTTSFVLGLAGGLAGRSSSRGLMAGLVGGALGGLVGVGASLVLLPWFFRQMVPDPNEMLLPMLIHGGIWTAVGLIGGAAFAVGLGDYRRIVRAVVGAALGAVLATVLFHVLSASFAPDSAYAEPLAASVGVRLLSRMLVTVLVAVGACCAILGRESTTKPAASRPGAGSLDV